MNPFPLEIWHAMTIWLGTFDQLRYLETNKSANGALTRQQRVHLRLWTNIFKDDTWISKVLACGLRPVIFGVDLDAIGNHDTAKTYINISACGQRRGHRRRDEMLGCFPSIAPLNILFEGEPRSNI